MISGFVQFAIQEGLTPIPDYNSENTLMVTNGVSRDIKVSSSYWIDNKLPGDDYENDLLLKQASFHLYRRILILEALGGSWKTLLILVKIALSIILYDSYSMIHTENLFKYCGATECTFDVNTTYTRTPTFDWFNEYNEHGNYELKIIDSKLGFCF